MKNSELAKAFVRDAGIILEESKDSLQRGHYHRVVRKCQEAVELALKGILRLKGIEYPKSHKIGKVLTEALKDEVDTDFLQRAADISDQLAIDREPSFYGSDEGPAEELFDIADAEESVTNAEYVITCVKELLRSKTRT